MVVNCYWVCTELSTYYYPYQINNPGNNAQVPHVVTGYFFNLELLYKKCKQDLRQMSTQLSLKLLFHADYLFCLSLLSFHKFTTVI